MRHGSFGASGREHGQEFGLILRDLEVILTRGERVMHGGDCHAAMRALVHSSHLHGQAQAHRDEAATIQGLSRRWILAGTRLNRLEVAVRGCVQG